MELALFFYAAGVIGNLAGFFLLSAISLTGFYLAVGILGAINADCQWESKTKQEAKAANRAFFKGYKWMPIVGALLFLISAIMPSKDTMYTMAAAYGVQTAAENPNVQRVAGKSLQVLEGKLNEFLKEEKK